jgi:hypothetical protein
MLSSWSYFLMPLIVVNGKLLLIAGSPSESGGELLSLRSVEELSWCPIAPLRLVGV